MDLLWFATSVVVLVLLACLPLAARSLRRRALQPDRCADPLLTRVVETMPDPFYVKGPDGRFLLVNDALCVLAGRARDDILGREAPEVFPGRLGAASLKNDAMTLACGFEDVAEETAIDADGRQRTFMTRKALYIDETGRRHIVGVIRDLTSRKRAERALAQSESRYRRIVETANEGIWVVDARWRTTYANAVMAMMLGTSPADMTGRPVADFLFPEDAELHRAMLRREALPPGGGLYERRLKRADGQTLWALIAVSSEFDASGRFAGSVGMFTNITERKRAEETRNTPGRRQKRRRNRQQGQERIPGQHEPRNPHALKRPPRHAANPRRHLPRRGTTRLRGHGPGLGPPPHPAAHRHPRPLPR